VSLSWLIALSSNYGLAQNSLQEIRKVGEVESCVDNFEANDNTSTATLVFKSALNNGSSDYMMQGNIGWSGDQDWYKINIGYHGTLTINLSNLPYNYDLELYGSSGLSQWISGSYNTGTSSEVITYNFTGSSSTVYAKVYANQASQYSTATCYSIEFVWMPSCTMTALIPILSSPSANETILTLTPTLVWSAISDATNYGVYIRDVQTNVLVVDNNCATNTNSYTVPTGYLSANNKYKWNVQANVNCGSCVSAYATAQYFQIGPIGIKQETEIRPTEYSLSQNFPNPFNPSTTITFDLPVSGIVQIKVYDVLGREIKTLLNEFKNAGRYNVEFNAGYLQSGTYFYKFTSGEFTQIKKLILLK